MFQGPIKIDSGEVFPHGALLIAAPEAVRDFDASTKENPVQQRDKITNKLLWSVSVMDLDPEARRGSREVAVKIPADHQPEMPASVGELVEFDGMSVTPWVDDRGSRARLGYSFRATGIRKVSTGSAKGSSNGAVKAGA